MDLRIGLERCRATARLLASWLERQTEEFYFSGNNSLPEKCRKCIELSGDYINAVCNISILLYAWVAELFEHPSYMTIGRHWWCLVELSIALVMHIHELSMLCWLMCGSALMIDMCGSTLVIDVWNYFSDWWVEVLCWLMCGSALMMDMCGSTLVIDVLIDVWKCLNGWCVDWRMELL